MRALLALLVAACTPQGYTPSPTAIDYCELPNAEAELGCNPETLTAPELLACEAKARQQSVRIVAGIPTARREPGAKRRMPAE